MDKWGLCFHSSVIKEKQMITVWIVSYKHILDRLAFNMVEG